MPFARGNLAAKVYWGNTLPLGIMPASSTGRAGADLGAYLVEQVRIVVEFYIRERRSSSARRARLVFTNGCFDLLHAGHVDLLQRARALGDRLIVGVNSDASVQGLKGPARPFIGERDRVAILRALRAVDDVVLFDDPTPLRLIEQLEPDVLVKGGDWAVENIVGAESVLKRGGEVHSLPLLPGYSTTSIAECIQQRAELRPWRRAS